MNPEEINKAIAMIVKGYDEFDSLLDDGVGRLWIGRKLFGSSKGDDNWYPVDDYYRDLNACHEMEKFLDKNDLWDDYEYHLSHCNTAYSFHAGAPERCEAFLRTTDLRKREEDDE